MQNESLHETLPGWPESATGDTVVASDRMQGCRSLESYRELSGPCEGLKQRASNPQGQLDPAAESELTRTFTCLSVHHAPPPNLPLTLQILLLCIYTLQFAPLS